MNPINKFIQRTKTTARAVLFVFLGASVTVSEAALLGLSDSPLYLITSVEPNVLLTFDDSGSMSWAFLPDQIGQDGRDDERRGCSSSFNRIYFDPTVTYDAPVDSAGQPLNATPTSFTAAYRNGFDTTAGTVNLSTSYQASWDPDDVQPGGWPAMPTNAGCGWSGAATLSGTGIGTNNSARAAFYFTYNAGCGDPNNNLCYDLVQHNNGAAGGAWSAATQQNFANWFSYYRTRNLMAKTAAGRAFSRFGGNVRIAGQHLNNTTAGTGTSIRFLNSINFMEPFTGTARTNFFTRLYNSPAGGGTPLLPAMERAGNHFSLPATNANSPYRDVPGTLSSPERSCRQNFHVLMTDGVWNGGIGTSIGNRDGANQTLGDGTSFAAPMRPYSDTWPDTLADKSFFYWQRDLRTDLTNNVPTRYTDNITTNPAPYWNPVNDPANWQHMVNFTIGLGVNGSLNFPGDYNSLLFGPATWPEACNNIACTNGNIDDLWHAALNSRGRYFSARNPTELVDAFTSVINDVADRISSASAAALNASTLTGNNYVYQSRFNSGDWTGQLLAYYINPATATINATPSWDAGAMLNGQHYDTQRNIITYKPSNNRGIPFRWPAAPATPGAGELDTTQSTALNYNPSTATYDTQGAARLNYLRGDASNEGTGNNYRIRNRTCGMTACPAGTNTGSLGDTINSAPVFVGAPMLPYLDTMEAQPYSTFRTTYATRTPMVYVGANDGMLHGFDANTGRERIAYVPSKVYGNLSRLTANPYAHRSFVDGNPMPADVFYGGAWHTILVGSLRHGGQGIYALDITNPSNFTEGNASSTVLWEFNDNHDADLGYTYAEPVIAKMANGRWAVILANGYNNSEANGAVSTTGRAVLYILFIDDGINGWNEVIKIDTGVGSAATPNGLASPAAVDINGDNVVDYVYAGDLQGNMWKFDLTSTNSSNWTSAANRRVIYRARDAASNPQPITSRPQVGRHPVGETGYIVYFGTGKYIETVDANTLGATPQTFYAVWDESGIATPTRSNLLQQTVTSTQTVSGASYRTTSNNSMVWRVGPPYPSPSYIGWYMDMPTTGERIVTDAVLLEDRILFTTVIPSDDPCSSGGSGWLMELSAYSGTRLPSSPFDVNNDGVFDGNDLLPSGGTNIAASGTQLVGIPSSPTVLVGGPASSTTCTGARCGEQKVVSTSAGNIEGIANNPTFCSYCRASWRQIR